MLSDTVLLALISSLGTIIVGYIGRWILFRTTMSSKFAIGADEEFKAFRFELQAKIKVLEIKIDNLIILNNALVADKLTRDFRIVDLEEELASAKGRITELEAFIKIRDQKIVRQEERIDGLKSQGSEIKEG